MILTESAPPLVRWTVRTGALALLAGLAPGAFAQTYPDKPIRIVVPFPPGGNIDLTGRAIAPGLSELLGVSVVIDNRGGASGTIGTDLVAKSPPDGYSLVVASTGTVGGAPALYPKLPYDPLKDLAAIGMVNDTPIVVLVHPAIRAKNLRELIALARESRGRMTYGSAGPGSTNHLAGALLEQQAKITLTHVPYKGSGPALIDLMGGHIDVYFDQLSSSSGHIRAGKLRGLAVTVKQRAKSNPDIPTTAEAGLPGYEASTYTGLMVAAGTPRAIVDRLAAATAKVVNSDAVRERFAAMGSEAKSSTPEQFTELIRSDIRKWARVVKEAGIRIE